jgi:putative peptidoglycan lipid II flippase
MALELQRTLRVTLAIIAPLAAAVACLGWSAAGVLGFVPTLRPNADAIGLAVAAFAPAMIAFTVHYLVLRGFYADEDTRTPFFVQVLVAATNIVAALVLTHDVEPRHVAPMLALSFGIAYAVGATVSATLLSRRLGGLVDRESRVFAMRLLISLALAVGAMLGAVAALDALGLDRGEPVDALVTLVVAGGLGAVAYLVGTRLTRMQELTHLVRALRGRSA